MSQFNVVKNASNPDQVYFDVTVSNFQSTTTVPPIFYYNEQRTLPFISVPEDYYLSILRFTVETGSVPVLIPSIQPNQPDRDLTIYSVGLTYDYLGTTYSAQEFVTWSPQDKSADVPPPPNQTSNKVQVNDTGYYNCYSYTYFLARIGLAYEAAFATLDGIITGLGGALPTIHPPYLNWDTTSASAQMIADVDGYDLNPALGADPIKIFMNAPLFTFFNSFPSLYLGYSTALQGRNFQITPFNVGSTNLTLITPVGGGPQWNGITVYQEYSTIANWTPVTAVVFTSNTLPIQPEQVSTPLVFNDQQQLALGGNNADIANIITDLVSDSGEYRPNLVYTPSAQYRYITLYGNRPLFNLDLSIFYRLKTGALVPFRIASGQAVTIKIAFIKKGTLGTGPSK